MRSSCAWSSGFGTTARRLLGRSLRRKARVGRRRRGHGGAFRRLALAGGNANREQQHRVVSSSVLHHAKRTKTRPGRVPADVGRAWRRPPIGGQPEPADELGHSRAPPAPPPCSARTAPRHRTGRGRGRGSRRPSRPLPGRRARRALRRPAGRCSGGRPRTSRARQPTWRAASGSCDFSACESGGQRPPLHARQRQVGIAQHARSPRRSGRSTTPTSSSAGEATSRRATA